MSADPTIVCVLGMHRSGTSLVARILNLLGVDLGPHEQLMRPGPGNPTGHWESLPIKEINDEILRAFGGTWAAPPDFPPDWESGTEVASLRQRARFVVETGFAHSPLWGFKDPRTCLTAPFWQRILPPMRFVVCIRNPLDVAASLAGRVEDNLPFDMGVELWFRYLQAALSATAGRPRHFLFYEDVMTDPTLVVTGLARFVGLEGEAAQQEIRTAIGVAASDTLWTHRTASSNVIDATRLPFHVKAFYLALRQHVAGPEGVDAEILDVFGEYAAESGRRVAALQRTLEKLRADRAALEHRLAERSAEIERLIEHHAENERRRADQGSSSAMAAYDRVVEEVRARAQAHLPPDATVLVAAKGDDALLRLDGARAWHFPMDGDGRYLGHHPAGATAALAQLEALRARGADHLLLPKTTLWWLDHYPELRRHLHERYVPLVEDEVCALYRLGTPRPTGPIAALAAIRRTVATVRIGAGRDPSVLDWRSGLGLAEHLPEISVFSPPDDDGRLPYVDDSVDVVVVASGEAERVAEAVRVATGAVVALDPAKPDRCEVRWIAGDHSGWGTDVNVTLIPDFADPLWEASVLAVADTLGAGFEGGLTIVGSGDQLGRAGALAPGTDMRAVEVPDDATLAARARASVSSGNQRVQVLVTAPAAPLPDWLPSLLAFLRDGQDGVVGARILSAVGALQDAGGLLTSDGARERRGQGDPDPDRPQYCFVRRVDFCSPPLLATTRDLLERLGGLGDDVPSHEALVDYSLRASRDGAPVYYQPQARVVAIADGMS